MLAVLQPWTPERIEGAEVNRRVSRSAQPAPLVPAVTAGHMVAAGNLLHDGLTLLALLDVGSLNR